MFELLLQADKALANGSLDQAEKTYWQLIELDPTNAIAVAGLARVSMERGDDRLARTFASRALGIDPDSIAARKVLESLDKRAAGTADVPSADEPDAMAGPLRAAEQLEALSRRRGSDAVAAGDASESSGTAGHGRARAKAAATPRPDAAEPEADDEAEAAEPAAERPPDAAAPAKAPARGSRGRTRPDQIGPLPSEPLPARRQAGRLAAAAAAAAAVAREPTRPRREPHHAMPPGRKFFEPGSAKSPLADAFSSAEMAAAVEAVDAVDDAAPTSFADAEAEATQAAGLADVMSDLDGTDADDTIALRIALISGSAELEAAERDAAESTDDSDMDMFEAAEAAAGATLSARAGRTMPQPAGEVPEAEFEAAEAAEAAEALAAAMARAESLSALESAVEPDAEESGADEFEAAEAQAQSQAGRELGPRWESVVVAPATEMDAADAAEAAAAAEAVREVSRAADVVNVRPASQARPQLPAAPAEGDEPSEEEAEAQALREALAIVLDTEGDGTAAEPPSDSTATGSEPESETGADASLDTEGENPRRKPGLFRRFRGS
jgi:hypothetical protein